MELKFPQNMPPERKHIVYHHPLTQEEWNALGQPHIWHLVRHVDGVAVFHDSAWGWNCIGVMNDDTNEVTIGDWSVLAETPISIVALEAGEAYTYVYLDKDYYGVNIGGLYKRL